MVDNIHKYFYKFLKKNLCLRQFVGNVKKHHPECKDMPLLDILKRFPCPGVGFIWMDTLEGTEFWAKIDDRWYSFIEKC